MYNPAPCAPPIIPLPIDMPNLHKHGFLPPVTRTLANDIKGTVAQRHHRRNLATRCATDPFASHSSQKLLPVRITFVLQVGCSEATAQKLLPVHVYAVPRTVSHFRNLHLRFRRRLHTLAASTFVFDDAFIHFGNLGGSHTLWQPPPSFLTTVTHFGNLQLPVPCPTAVTHSGTSHRQLQRQLRPHV